MTTETDTVTANRMFTDARYRYVVAVALALLAFVADAVTSAWQYNAPDYLSSLLSTLPFFVLAAAAAMVMPATRSARTVALALLAGAFVVEDVLANMQEFAPPSARLHGPGVFGWIPPILIVSLLTCAWLSLRSRRGLAYLAAVPLRVALYFGVWALIAYWLQPAIISASGNDYPAAIPVLNVLGGGLDLLAWAATAWVAAFVDGAARRSQSNRAAVDELRYTENPGLPAAGTNGLAIASLIVVFFSSIIGLILGHVALHQINRTGEQGRGLALAAVIIGWVTTGIGVMIVIIAVAVGFSHGQTGAFQG